MNQGQIQDFLRGDLNIEVISEAGGLGMQLPRNYTKIMPNARFRAYLSKYKTKYGVGVWWVQPLGRYRLFYLTMSRNNTF